MTNRLAAISTLCLTLACAHDALPRIDPTDGRCTRRANSEEVAGPCTLSVLTYNVHGISNWLINMETHGDERFRSASLGWLANDYDLVLLQEDFEYHSRIFEGPALAFVERGPGPRWTMWPLRFLTLPFHPFHFRAPYGSGLTIAAPALQPVELRGDGRIKRVDGIIAEDRLTACNGWISDGSDCFSTKGLLGMRLRLRNGAEIDVYTTHLDAGSSRGDRDARRTQLRKIAKRIKKKSKGRAVILAGDLNSEYDDAPASRANPPLPDPPDANGNPPNPDYQLLYDELLEPLGLKDTGARQAGAHFGHRVDWVLYRSTPEPEGDEDRPALGVDLQVQQAGEDQRFRHPVNRGLDVKSEDHRGILSDHPALGVCFVISRIDAGAGAAPKAIGEGTSRADSKDALPRCVRESTVTGGDAMGPASDRG